MPLQFPSRDFTLQYISSSYQSVLQIYTPDSASYVLDGLGNVIGFIFTSSIGQQILTVDQPAPFAITASYSMNGGSGFTFISGAFYPITSSWAVNAIAANTADFALESRYSVTASYVSGSISNANHATYADTASYISGSISNAISASYAAESDHAIQSDTASLAFLSIFSDTASYAFESVFADTASLAFFSTYAGSSSYALGAGSASYSLTASYALNGGSGGSSVSASWASQSLSASYATTASYVATASYYPPQVFQTTVPSASWVSASVFITTAQTASYITASNVVGTVTSASYANSASYLLNYSPTISASYASASLSASYALSASWSPTVHVEKGLISGSSFSGIPYSFTVNYAQPFINTIYVVSVIGEEARLWTGNTRTTSSFVINSNSNQPLVGMVSYRVEQI